MRLLTVGVFGLCSVACVACGGTDKDDVPDNPAPENPPSDVREKRVAALAEPLAQEGWTASLLVGVVDAKGADVFAFGEVAAGRPPDTKTLYEIGSITKTFTGLLLAQAVEDGALALTTPVRDLLPPDVTVPAFEGREILLGDLVTQSSGLPAVPDNLDLTKISNPYAEYQVSDLYAALGNYQLTRAPGARYEYSNFGFGLLGHALGRRRGSDYLTALEDHILELLFAPLPV